jgi:hypothetical protein
MANDNQERNRQNQNKDSNMIDTDAKNTSQISGQREDEAKDMNGTNES